MTSLESDLKQLPEPAVPEGLAAGVTARIARIDLDPGEARTPRAGRAQMTAAEARRDRLAWAAALVGLAVSLGAQVYRVAVGEVTLGTSLQTIGGIAGLVEMLPASPAVGVLAIGLLMYLAGLFAPMRSTGR